MSAPPIEPAACGSAGRDVRSRVKEVLAAVKPLAAEYYRLTGKPLGVTGEVAEYVASELLGLELVPPRTAGYDALRQTVAGPRRIQIKGEPTIPQRGAVNGSVRSSPIASAMS